jgi:hypothetical protein
MVALADESIECSDCPQGEHDDDSDDDIEDGHINSALLG